MPRKRKPFPKTLQGAIDRLIAKKASLMAGQITVDTYIDELDKFSQVYKSGDVLPKRAEEFNMLEKNRVARAKKYVVSEFNDITDNYGPIYESLEEGLSAKSLSKEAKLEKIKQLKVLAELYINTVLQFCSHHNDAWKMLYKVGIIERLYLFKGHLKFWNRALEQKKDVQEISDGNLDVNLETFKYQTLSVFLDSDCPAFLDSEFDDTIEELFVATRMHLQKIARDNSAIQRMSKTSCGMHAGITMLSRWVGFEGVVDWMGFAGCDGFVKFSIINYLIEWCRVGVRNFEEPFFPSIMCTLRFEDLINQLGDPLNAIEHLKQTTPNYKRYVQLENYVLSPLRVLPNYLMASLCCLSGATWWQDILLKMIVLPAALSLLYTDVDDPKNPKSHPMSVVVEPEKSGHIGAAIKLKVLSHNYPAEVSHGMLKR